MPYSPVTTLSFQSTMAPRVPKSTASAPVAAAPVAAAPAPSVVASAPAPAVEAKKEKAPRKPKATAEAKKEDVVAPVVDKQVAAGETTASTETTEDVPIADKVTALQADLQAKINQVVGKLVEAYTQKVERLYKAEIKSLQHQVTKLASQKGKGRRAKAAAVGENGEVKPRAASGFNRPTAISDELAKFMGVPAGTLVPRSNVTKAFSAYVKEHKIADPANGRNVIPDATLKKLLNLKEGDQLGYFNLQTYLKPHFVKPATATA